MYINILYTYANIFVLVWGVIGVINLTRPVIFYRQRGSELTLNQPCQRPWNFEWYFGCKVLTGRSRYVLQGGVLIHQKSVKYGLPWDGLVGMPHSDSPISAGNCQENFVFLLMGPTVAIQFCSANIFADMVTCSEVILLGRMPSTLGTTVFTCGNCHFMQQAFFTWLCAGYFWW